MNNALVEFPKSELLQRLALSDSGFVFDPVTGNSFTVNGTGLAVLRLLQKEKDPVRIVASLTAEYETDNREAERDLIEFAGHLRGIFK